MPEDDLEKIVAIERLITIAYGYFSARMFDRVATACTKILLLDPANEFAEDILDFIQERDREATALYEYVETHAEDPDLDSLWRELCRARGLYPNHPFDDHFGRRVEERMRRYRRAMNDGFWNVNRGAKREALEVFREAHNANPSYPQLPSIVRDLEDDIYRGKPLPLGW